MTTPTPGLVPALVTVDGGASFSSGACRKTKEPQIHDKRGQRWSLDAKTKKGH
jgi:hypothetical protein